MSSAGEPPVFPSRVPQTAAGEPGTARECPAPWEPAHPSGTRKGGLPRQLSTVTALLQPNTTHSRGPRGARLPQRPGWNGVLQPFRFLQEQGLPPPSCQCGPRGSRSRIPPGALGRCSCPALGDSQELHRTQTECLQKTQGPEQLESI